MEELELEELLEDSGVEVELLGALDEVSEFTVVSDVLVLSFAQSRPRQLMTVPLLPLVLESELAVLAEVLSLFEVEADPELERLSTSVFCVLELREVEVVFSVDRLSLSVRTLPAHPATASPEVAAIAHK